MEWHSYEILFGYLNTDDCLYISTETDVYLGATWDALHAIKWLQSYFLMNSEKC